LKNFIFTFCLLLPIVALGQFNLKIKIVDDAEKTGIPSVSYKLFSVETSKSVNAGFSSIDGDISVSNLSAGAYTLSFTSVGYDSLSLKIKIDEANLDLGTVSMKPSLRLMREVEVRANADRVTMKGDTTQFNADAYKVNPDATADDLIRKMPTLTVENGVVKAQGENVKRVLIDGKEFFGTDPSLALKNLPAEIIQKIEVFDRLSDQAQLSGFDDGNSEKTINIVTKSGKTNGEFGKLYAGMGTNDRYAAGGNVNNFKGERKISLIGISNNINQQNFGSEDLLGALGSGSSQRGGSGGRSGGGGRPQGGGNSTDPSNFMVSSQGGITKTSALGFNYIDKWSEKLQVSVSYFFNKMNNYSQDSSMRTTFTGVNSEQYYGENSFQSNTNYNHRINSRFTYELDKNNSIIFSPNISLQGNTKATNLAGITSLDTSDTLNTIDSDQASKKNGYNLSGNLSFRHRFEKRGRSFSIGVGVNNLSNLGSGSLVSKNQTFLPTLRSSLVDQISADTTINTGYNVKVDYNEPISENSVLNFSYTGNFSFNKAEKQTLAYDKVTADYDILNTVLSNSFLNNYNTNAAGIGYRFSKDRKYFITANLNFQNAELDSKQTFPIENITNRSFFNVLPFVSFNYRPSRNKSLRLIYRSSSRAPSINQLQNVVNNTNPIQLSTGNPDLDQSVSNLITIRFNNTNTEKGSSFFTFFSSELVQNNISTSIFTASKDSIFRGILLAKGSQLSIPINYGNTLSLRTLSTYGFPAKIIKSNINLSGGYTYTQTPTLINGIENLSRNNSLTSGIVLGSNISKNVDFTVSYTGSYNIIKNTVNQNLNNNYYSQLVSLKLNLLTPKGLLLNTEGVNTVFNSIGSDFDQVYTLVNLSLGQKFMKNQRAEIKVTAFDIFKQNKSISRVINASYIEDTRSLVLTRYFLATFTYNIRNFR
jgi:outer membrane receptor protein involved in Fe transport